MILLLSGSAFAQEGFGLLSPGELWDNRGIDAGTPEYDHALAAARTNTQIYGPLAYLGRSLLPGMHDLGGSGEPQIYLGMEWHQIFGVTRVPKVCDWDLTQDQACVFHADKGPVLQHPGVDSSAATFAIGVRWHFLSVYYVANSTMTQIQDDPYATFLMDEVFVIYSAVLESALPVVLGGVALLDPESAQYLPPTQVLVGVGAHSPPIDLYFAWLLPDRFYTNLSSQTVGLFAEGLLDDTKLASALGRAPFLRSGLLQKAVAPIDSIGLTSAFARKVRFVSADALAPKGAPVEDRDGTDLWTVHLDQDGLLGWVAVDGAVAVKPTLLVHQAMVGFDNVRETDDGDLHVRVVGGVMGLPAIPELALTRVTLPAAHVEVTSHANGFTLAAGGGWNDPDVLAYFPYARGSVNVWASIAPGPRE